MSFYGPLGESSNAWSRDDDDDGLPDDPSIARPTLQRAPPSSSTRHFKTQGSPSLPSLGAFADPLSPESAWASRGGSDAGTPKPTQEAQLSSIAPELVHHRGPNDADAMPLMSTNGPLDSSSESADEEAFVYQQQDAPPHENANGAHHRDEGNEEEEEEEEDFVYPSGTDDVVHVASVTSSSPLPSEGIQGPGDQSKGPPRPRPRPIDYQRLHELCTSGSLESLQLFFQQTTEMTGTSSFALANEPNPSSGQMPIHYAAKQGKLDLLKWLVEDVGALVEIEDREGETALHKAALAGRLPVLVYLLSHGAEADAADGDGWTALHNASSRGYLDLVKYLVETASASLDVKGGRGGWTPLMNASSNGHLPIVRFLTTKHHADPFQRNSAGETAYDVAAASFEIFICQVLESYEAERWSALRFASAAGATQQRSYNPLYLHTTVPVLIYQNERLDTRLSALATNGGRPRWSGSGAGRPHKPDRRAPGTLPPGPLSSSLARHTPMRREDVDLPRRSQPYKLRLPTKSQSRAAAIAAQHRQRANGEDFSTTPTPESILEQQRRGSVSSSVREQDEPSHFWLCDWQLDRTHPQADHVDGWQYAQSFDAAEDRWSAQVPPPLTRLLEGKGLGSAVTRAISGGHLPGPGQSSVLGDSNGDSEATPTGWVRRRRWVRVMRRRLDIDFGDELEAAELSDHSVEATQLHVDLSSTTTRTAQEAAQIECDELGADADYVAKAIALAGAKEGATPADAMGDLSPQALQSRSVRLELAINELRGSAFDDQDVGRRTRAEDLLKEFTLQVSQLRQAAGMGEGDDANDDEEEEDDDEEFIYPNSFKDTQSTITRIAGASQAGNLATNRPAIGPRVNSSYSVFGNTTPVAPPSEAGATARTASNHRSADLARATEFRVPTNEAPATLPIHQHPTLREATLIPNWEPDEDAADCRNCGKRFTFFTRKHHCRRCGRIFCADCSSHRAQLSADELVIDPGVPEMFFAESSMGISRICAGCHAERQLPPALRNTRGGADLMLRSAAQERGGPSTADAAEGYGATTTAFSSSVSSRASELNECPVCNVTLAQFGCQQDQEEHLRICLENGGGGSVQGGRYLVYRLQEDSPIISKECVICFEELLAGQAVARLPCLCFFHEPCVASWLGRGKSCPTHAR